MLNRLSRVFLAAAAVSIAGCQAAPAPPPRVPVPTSTENGHVKTYEPLRPLGQPPAQDMLPPPAFDDAPLVTQAVPEEPAYVSAYNGAGKPRVAVLVDRTIDGQYDDAKPIDYEALELALADTLAANGKVTLISPSVARQRVSDQQMKDLQTGQPGALSNAADKLDADVIVQVHAQPTRQTSDGQGIRVVVEAINARGGESIARSFVDVPPPLDKPNINKYTRFLARKTMYALAESWRTMANEPPDRRDNPPPSPQQQQPPSTPPAAPQLAPELPAQPPPPAAPPHVAPPSPTAPTTQR